MVDNILCFAVVSYHSVYCAKTIWYDGVCVCICVFNIVKNFISPDDRFITNVYNNNKTYRFSSSYHCFEIIHSDKLLFLIDIN